MNFKNFLTLRALRRSLVELCKSTTAHTDTMSEQITMTRNTILLLEGYPLTQELSKKVIELEFREKVLRRQVGSLEKAVGSLEKARAKLIEELEAYMVNDTIDRQNNGDT